MIMVGESESEDVFIPRVKAKELVITVISFAFPTPRGGHSIVKNTGGWLNSLGSGILVGKDILGFFKNIDLDNS